MVSSSLLHQIYQVTKSFKILQNNYLMKLILSKTIDDQSKKVLNHQENQIKMHWSQVIIVEIKIK